MFQNTSIDGYLDMRNATFNQITNAQSYANMFDGFGDKIGSGNTTIIVKDTVQKNWILSRLSESNISSSKVTVYTVAEYNAL